MILFFFFEYGEDMSEANRGQMNAANWNSLYRFITWYEQNMNTKSKSVYNRISM